MKPPNRAIRPESKEAPQDKEQRHLLTLEALAETDAGEGIEHAAVQAWAKSLSNSLLHNSATNGSGHKS